MFSCAVDNAGEVAKAKTLAPQGWDVVGQQGDDLGARIEHARQAGQADHVLVMGSDSPTLPHEQLVEAFDALATSAGRTAVIVPTDDGGYAVIGFSGPSPELLTDIPWSTEEVVDATREAANAAGIPLVELAVAYDIDQPEDLVRATLEVDSELHPATSAALASIR